MFCKKCGAEIETRTGVEPVVSPQDELENIMDDIRNKINEAHLPEKDNTYWYQCGLYDAIEIIKKYQSKYLSG